MRTSESKDTSKVMILVPRLNPEVRNGLAALLGELRVRGTSANFGIAGRWQRHDSSAALNPKFATELAAPLGELRVRGTSAAPRNDKGDKKNAGHEARRSLVGTKPTITFQRGTAGCRPICHLGGTAYRFAYSTTKLCDRQPYPTTWQPVCQPCGSRKPICNLYTETAGSGDEWVSRFRPGIASPRRSSRRSRAARSSSAALLRRESRGTPGCAPPT